MSKPSKADVVSPRERMRLKAYFAGQALAGMALKDDSVYSSSDHASGLPAKRAKWCATAAWRYANVMMETMQS